jgi:hypothetical protein
MKKMIFAHGADGLSPIAAAAISLLADAQNGD